MDNTFDNATTTKYSMMREYNLWCSYIPTIQQFPMARAQINQMKCMYTTTKVLRNESICSKIEQYGSILSGNFELGLKLFETTDFTLESPAIVDLRWNKIERFNICLVYDLWASYIPTMPMCAEWEIARSNLLTFKIHFEDKMFIIYMPTTATVENLKNKIATVVHLPFFCQAIRGWPTQKFREAQKLRTQLSSLVYKYRELYLTDLTKELTLLHNSIGNQVVRRLYAIFCLTITQQPSGQRYRFNFSGQTTISEIKGITYYFSGIPVRSQEWRGWPFGCANSTKLAYTGISLTHSFILKCSPRPNSKKCYFTPSLNVPIINEPDTENATKCFKNVFDYGDQKTHADGTYLILEKIEDQTTGTKQFVANYRRHYSATHPTFFIGSMREAISKSCQLPSPDRKVLAIYLHHANSKLTKDFCCNLLCHEYIIGALSEKFLLFGWDVTLEHNKSIFLSQLAENVGDDAVQSVCNIPIDKFPVLLLICSTPNSTKCELSATITGNTSIHDLYFKLMNTYENHTPQLLTELLKQDMSVIISQFETNREMLKRLAAPQPAK